LLDVSTVVRIVKATWASSSLYKNFQGMMMLNLAPTVMQ
jgi:hypothetical protein